jgi:hypothetical protein
VTLLPYSQDHPKNSVELKQFKNNEGSRSRNKGERKENLMLENFALRRIVWRMVIRI